MLANIKTAAQPLLSALHGEQPLPPRRWLDAMGQSFNWLGLTETFTMDAAGDRILQELQAMRQFATGRTIKMRWREFRTWLGRTLDKRH